MRNTRILQELRRWPTVYMSTLSILEGCPQASIRRSLQELRRDGYIINLTNGVVRLCN